MDDDRDLPIAIIRRLLQQHPGWTKKQLLPALRQEGAAIADYHVLNPILYGHPEDFWHDDGGGLPKWYATLVSSGLPPVDEPGHGVGPVSAGRSLDLFPWQERALRAWRDSGARGVVEAVTGAGKTRLALQAIIDALCHGQKVVVIVPTVELVRQWHRELATHVQPSLDRPATVETLGAGHAGSLRSGDLLVATASSAARWQMLEDGASGALLVADECHHYGAETWSRALEVGFGSRLGLTATYERSDDGVAEWLDPYFGGLCYKLGYREALADGVIAPFRIAFVGVEFASEAEFDAYQEASARASRYRRRLVAEWGLTPEPFGLFMREVQQLRNADVAEGSRLAGFYLGAFTKRRQVMAESLSKLDRLAHLAPAVDAADRTIVFAQTVVAAEAAVAALEGLGHPGAAIESLMTDEERRETFDQFERGDLSVVAAPKLLDEGIDVPAADLAFLLATSRSRRQLIQRMGRVIRRKSDGRPARVVVMYLARTTEDPDEGAHEDFLEEVLDVAEGVEVFEPGSPPASIITYLDPTRRPVRRRPVARRSRAVASASTPSPNPEPPAISPAPPEYDGPGVLMPVQALRDLPTGFTWRYLPDGRAGLELGKRVTGPHFLMVASVHDRMTAVIEVCTEDGGDLGLAKALRHLESGLPQMRLEAAEAKRTPFLKLLKATRPYLLPWR